MKMILSVLVLMTSLAVQAREIPANLSASNPNNLDWFGDIQPPTQVTPRIWRSGRPTEDSLNALYKQGVRLIIDLENDPAVIADEAALASRLSMKFVSYPTDSFWAPDDAKMNEILKILKDSPVPVLVHCYHGEDRTGLVIGLERVLLEKWTPARAYDEMLNKGFHQILLGLDQYFRDKVGSF